MIREMHFLIRSSISNRIVFAFVELPLLEPCTLLIVREEDELLLVVVAAAVVPSELTVTCPSLLK